MGRRKEKLTKEMRLGCIPAIDMIRRFTIADLRKRLDDVEAVWGSDVIIEFDAGHNNIDTWILKNERTRR